MAHPEKPYTSNLWDNLSWSPCTKFGMTSLWTKLLVKSTENLRYGMSRTRVKSSHLVTSLPTSCQQVVFVLLVPSCQQVWNKLWTTCNNLVDIIRLVARLFWQVRYMRVDNLVTSLLYHGCNKLVNTVFVTRLTMPSSLLLQVVNSLFQTCYKLGTSSANTTCMIVDSLWTDL